MRIILDLIRSKSVEDRIQQGSSWSRCDLDPYLANPVKNGHGEWTKSHVEKRLDVAVRIPWQQTFHSKRSLWPSCLHWIHNIACWPSHDVKLSQINKIKNMDTSDTCFTFIEKMVRLNQVKTSISYIVRIWTRSPRTWSWHAIRICMMLALGGLHTVTTWRPGFSSMQGHICK